MVKRSLLVEVTLGAIENGRSNWSDSQRGFLVKVIENGPQAAGYQTGVWTGPMIRDFIEQRYGVRYHKHNIPRLLHMLGFRCRGRENVWHVQKQATWLRKTFSSIKKSPQMSRRCDVWR